ncbi:MAG: hypothetical protein ACI8UD_002350 [Planctomycetota bacterium]|jgi:membrane protein implicated in regulation of membrane protease activity
MDATLTPIIWLAIILQMLFGWIVFASAQVALEHWQTLPLAPTLSAVALPTASSVSLVLVSNRAVKVSTVPEVSTVPGQQTTN